MTSILMSKEARLDKRGFDPLIWFWHHHRQVGNVGGILSPTCLSHPLFSVNKKVIPIVWKPALFLFHMPGRKAGGCPQPFLHRKNVFLNAALLSRANLCRMWAICSRARGICTPGVFSICQGVRGTAVAWKMHLHIYDILLILLSGWS